MGCRHVGARAVSLYRFLPIGFALTSPLHSLYFRFGNTYRRYNNSDYKRPTNDQRSIEVDVIETSASSWRLTSSLYGWGRGARPLVTWELISWFLDELPWPSLNSNVWFPWKRKAGKKITESLGSTGTPWNNLIRNPSICWEKNRQTTKRWNGPKASSPRTKTQWRRQSVFLQVICRVSRGTESRVYLQREHLKFLDTDPRLKNRGAREVLWDWPNATTFTVILLTSPILHLRRPNWSRSLTDEVVFRLPSRCASPCVSFKCSRLVGKQKHSPMSTIDTHVYLSFC